VNVEVDSLHVKRISIGDLVSYVYIVWSRYVYVPRIVIYACHPCCNRSGLIIILHFKKHKSPGKCMFQETEVFYLYTFSNKCSVHFIFR
jgi:hypothetical protein